MTIKICILWYYLPGIRKRRNIQHDRRTNIKENNGQSNNHPSGEIDLWEGRVQTQVRSAGISMGIKITNFYQFDHRSFYIMMFYTMLIGMVSQHLLRSSHTKTGTAVGAHIRRQDLGNFHGFAWFDITADRGLFRQNACYVIVGRTAIARSQCIN